jgi:hypothetical protein
MTVKQLIGLHTGRHRASVWAHLAGQFCKDHQARGGEVEAGAGGRDAEQGNPQRRLIPEALDHLRGSMQDNQSSDNTALHT